jgi:hypothetical protein
MPTEVGSAQDVAEVLSVTASRSAAIRQYTGMLEPKNENTFYEPGIARDAVATGRLPTGLCFTPNDSAGPEGAEMRTAFMSIERAFLTYSEGMTLVATNAEPRDLGACRRR